MSSQTNTAEPIRLTDAERAEVVETLSCVRYVGIVMVVASALLFIFNSAGLQTWTRNLDGNAVTDGWVRETDNWHGVMQRLGFATPKGIMQRAMAETRDLTWPGLVGPGAAHAQDGTTDRLEEGFSDEDDQDIDLDKAFERTD